MMKEANLFLPLKCQVSLLVISINVNVGGVSNPRVAFFHALNYDKCNVEHTVKIVESRP